VNIVFDLDGTLIDSAPDIRAAANVMLVGEGAEPLDMDTTTSFIGNGIPKLVERAMRARGLPAADHARLTQAMLEAYDKNPATLTRLYDGLEVLLPKLKGDGHKLGICTNKPLAPTKQILDIFAITDLFDVIIGGDTLRVKKPNPAPLYKAYEALGDGERLYVGDSEVDAETAERAHIPFALFTEGYRKMPVETLAHVLAFKHFDALGSYIETPRS